MTTALTTLPQNVLTAPDIFEAKLRPAAPRAQSVVRTPLVNRLRASDASLVTVCAPAGYGKTTVLGQWAARDGRPFAWLRLDEADNDPGVLVRYLALALRQLPFEGLASAEPVAPRQRAATAIRRLTAALLAAQRPVVLVLDDVHHLRSRNALAVVAALAQHVPDHSTLVLAGRSVRLPVARARAEGRLFELGTDDLALSAREDELLLRSLGVEPGSPELPALRRRMEGWAAGTFLAGSGLDGPDRAGSGEDRFVADYFDFECTAGLTGKDARFLTRTAVLDQLCGDLCDHLLDTDDSGRRLEALARANLFVVRLDRERRWYRYHHAFREYLLGELRRCEPRAIPALHRRAAGWCEAGGDLAGAAAHAHAAGDLGAAARIVTRLDTWTAGRSTTGDAWLDWFDDPQLLSKHPAVAALGAWTHLVGGRPAAARRWRDALAEGVGAQEQDLGGDAPAALLAVLEAAVCESGVERMREDAQRSLEGLAPLGGWRSVALLLRGVAEILLAERERAVETLHEAAESAESVGATGTQAWALAELSLLAVTRDDDAEAEALVRAARTLVEEQAPDGDSESALVFASAARLHLRTGETACARGDLERADALASQLTHALPWHAVQTNLELGHAYLSLVDPAAARARLDRAGAVLRRRPLLGDLAAQTDGLREEVRSLAARRGARRSGLTTAELRLLPLLTTHLSFREIAAELYVSRNTVKTQAISVYRKLNASSRSEAIARARDLGLVELASPRSEFTHSG
jgi:LuxR family transcriptional regulator, maltose regulon positive regulatory protein